MELHNDSRMLDRNVHHSLGSVTDRSQGTDPSGELAPIITVCHSWLIELNGDTTEGHVPTHKG